MHDQSVGKDLFRRLVAMAEELAKRERVHICRYRVGGGATDAQIAVAEQALGATLDPTIEGFYREGNGACLVWFDRQGEMYEDRSSAQQQYSDFPPPLWALEDVSPIDGGLYFPPIETVFKSAMLDYYADTPEPLRVYGEDTDRQALAARMYPFDLPGTFHHAAFMTRHGSGSPDVIIVDDHSCLTDSYVTDFRSYVESILATWASVSTRMRHYLAGSIRREREVSPRGDGVAYWQAHPVSLSRLLPER